MRLSFIWVERTREAWLRSGIEVYRKRIEYYAQVRLLEIRARHAGRSQEMARRKEAEGILRSIPPRSHLICLDERGTEYDSRGLAQRIGLLEEQSVREIAWVIGGPFGLSKDVLDRAKEVIYLSRLTLTHRHDPPRPPRTDLPRLYHKGGPAVPSRRRPAQAASTEVTAGTSLRR